MEKKPSVNRRAFLNALGVTVGGTGLVSAALFGGLNKGFRNRIDAAQIGDSQWSADSVIVGRSPLLVLRLLEVG